MHDPRAAPQATPRMKIATQVAPFSSLRVNTLGKWPSSTIATGTRKYDITSELNVPTSLIMAAPTRAVPSHGPTTVEAMLAQLPADHTSACTWRCHTASTGIT